MEWLDPRNWPTDRIYGNSLQEWAIALGIAVLTAVGIRVLKALVQRQLEHTAAAQKSRTVRIMARTVAHTRWFFYLMLAVFLGARWVELPEDVSTWIRNLTVIAVLMQLGVWAQHAIHRTVAHVQSQREEQGEGAATMAVAVGFLGRLVVWVIILLLVLANLGVEITALVAGLGIGGVAAALAVQSLFGDVIGSLTIYFDRPFDVGDFIIVDDKLGNVERVGLRSTRVRSLWGEQLVFANGDLLKSRIQNYARMQERRIHFQFGVRYETPIDVVERIPGMVREIIEARDRLRFARSHFKAYGDYSLVFETAYYVLTPDYDVYMDEQQHINLEIGKRFEAEGIQFAFPTRTIHLEGSLTQAGAGGEGPQKGASA